MRMLLVQRWKTESAIGVLDALALASLLLTSRSVRPSLAEVSRTVRFDDVVEVVGAFEGAFEGRREGCRLRIGIMGTGGGGSNLEDRRRAAISSSSKTVASVRVLTGLK